MIKYTLHSDAYLDTCKHYRHIYDTPSIQATDAKWQEVSLSFTWFIWRRTLKFSLKALQLSAVFIALAPFDNEQSDLVHRIHSDAKMSKIPLFK